jgi:thiamine-phosphate pyrophosphorylase
MNRDARRAGFLKIDIYPVTCERLSAGRSNLEVLKAVIRGGAGIIQLREKEYSDKDLYHLALNFRKITREAGILLLIDDRLDLAMAVEADGVHLGQEDLPVAAARRLAPELLIGVSTHSTEEAVQAESDGADYVNIGPIFPTETKGGTQRFLGPDEIRAISEHIHIPYTVMGGISETNIDQVLAAGARRVAMVTAITQASDIAQRVRSLRERIGSYLRQDGESKKQIGIPKPAV